MDIQALVTGALGGTVIAALFALFGKVVIGRLKAKWNTELEVFKDSLNAQQKRLQAQLDNSVFVTRAHFDVELNAMKEVHQRLSEVKIVFRSLHPTSLRDEKKGEAKAALVEKLHVANERYFTKLEEWGAFLEPTLYDSFEHCYYGADEEYKRLALSVISDHDESLNCKYFFDNYRAACQGIRNRLKSLAILPKN
jgi:hypothetical protein